MGGGGRLIDYLPILVFTAIAVGFASFAVIASSLLGQKKLTPVKQALYECGRPTIGAT
jgi:NADH:ubiquinone oxidoreductase subunit 3 (subunit A)